MSIADNLHRVQERIARAAERAGRRADEITLVGVTKYVNTRKAMRLVTAGCHNLGESRPQELWKKAEEVPHFNTPVHWHLIGHLQRNKVARTLPLVSLIHSVDSERLMASINEARAAAADNPQPVPVLLEVNTSGEAAKHGLQPDKVESFVAAASNYPLVVIRGLMTMAAFEGGEAVAARNFASLRELRDRLQQNAPACVTLNELSMGMSDDFEVAIQEGATIVRIGSLLWNLSTSPEPYDEDREYNFYIDRNLRAHLTQSERWALNLAMKHIKLESYPPSFLQRALDEAPPEVVDASKLGYDELLSQFRERFRAASFTIARCSKCNQILRTPQAKMCIWCGHDWHHEG